MHTSLVLCINKNGYISTGVIRFNDCTFKGRNQFWWTSKEHEVIKLIIEWARRWKTLLEASIIQTKDSSEGKRIFIFKCQDIGIHFAHVMLSKLIWNLAMMHIHNAGSETTANVLKPSSPWYLSLSSFSLWHPQARREFSSFYLS
jgi:hypothetical protein